MNERWWEGTMVFICNWWWLLLIIIVLALAAYLTADLWLPALLMLL